MRRAVVMLAGAIAIAPSAAVPPAEPVTLAIPERANQALSIAAHDRMVAVTWLASSASTGSDVYLAISQDGGTSFGAPVRVNSTRGDAAGSGEMPPRVVIAPPRGGATPVLTVVWAAKREGGTRLLWAESADGGRRFTDARVLEASVGAGNRGWHAVAVDRAGRVQVLWLDHRDVPPTHRHAPGHDTARTAAPTADPTARAAPSKLHAATLGDSASARVITGSVCYCCKTALAVDGSTAYGAWRHVFPGSQRDIAMTVSRDGGGTFSTPTRVHADGWQYDGCPDDGPTLAITSDRHAHVVWPSPRDGTSASPMALFHASTRDGATFTSRTTLPVRGVAHHPIAVARGNAVLVAWDESTPTAKGIVIARSRVGLFGRLSFARGVVEGGEGGSYPALAVTAGGATVAWVAREGGRTVIRVAKLDI
ncbi:MAG: hypothetical protein MUF00_08190 [Gemmatimonadaceae bacterium]|jgi:hypothetical protein|nr:hypothetical protein [Gemmatimonadaceae bacterium]